MSGTKAGGLAAAETNKRVHGADFYIRTGALGGKASRTGGFYHSMVNGLTTHIEAGRKGGTISKRRPRR